MRDALRVQSAKLSWSGMLAPRTLRHKPPPHPDLPAHLAIAAGSAPSSPKSAPCYDASAYEAGRREDEGSPAAARRGGESAPQLCVGQAVVAALEGQASQAHAAPASGLPGRKCKQNLPAGPDASKQQQQQVQQQQQQLQAGTPSAAGNGAIAAAAPGTTNTTASGTGVAAGKAPPVPEANAMPTPPPRRLEHAYVDIGERDEQDAPLCSDLLHGEAPQTLQHPQPGSSCCTVNQLHAGSSSRPNQPTRTQSLQPLLHSTSGVDPAPDTTPTAQSPGPFASSHSFPCGLAFRSSFLPLGPVQSTGAGGRTAPMAVGPAPRTAATAARQARPVNTSFLNPNVGRASVGGTCATHSTHS